MRTFLLWSNRTLSFWDYRKNHPAVRETIVSLPEMGFPEISEKPWKSLMTPIKTDFTDEKIFE